MLNKFFSKLDFFSLLFWNVVRCRILNEILVEACDSSMKQIYKISDEF